MNVLAVIPARWKSKRFPGKPIAKISGLPMIVHGYRRTQEAKEVTDTVIATDDKRIVDVCKKYSLKFILSLRAPKWVSVINAIFKYRPP